MALQLATASTGVVRDSHYVVPSGTSTPIRTLLVEPQRTNLCIRSEEFDTWLIIGTNTPVTANATAAPNGTVTADLITQAATGPASAGRNQSVTYTGDGEKILSVYLKVGNGAPTVLSAYDVTATTARHNVRVTWTAGVPSVATAGGSGTVYPVEALANGWYRIMFSAAGIVAANTNDFRIYVNNVASAVSGDSVYAWGAQVENAVVPSSYIPTAATTVTRNADSLYWSIPALNPPREMTVYMRGVNTGAYIAQPVVARTLHIGDGNAGTDPRFTLARSGGNTNTQAFYDDGPTNNSGNAFPSPTPVLFDIIEHRGVLTTDWKAILGISVNGGTELTNTSVTAGTATPAWANSRLYIAGHNDAESFAFTNICVALGNQSRASMRTFAGVP